MRRCVLLSLVPLLALAAGCAHPAKPAGTARNTPDLRELGRPWPILVGEFDAPLTVIGHETRGLVFTIGRSGQVHYRLDYVRRRLTRVSPPAVAQPREARIVQRGSDKALFVAGAEISGTILPVAGAGFAQTGDRSALAFYEAVDGGAQLIYFDQFAGTRAIWRSLPPPPAETHLRWSPSGRYLFEVLPDQLIIHDRVTGFTVGSLAGTRPLLAPHELYLLFQRADGRPGLFDLRTGGDWPVLPISRSYRPFPAAVWSPDGGRVFLQAEATAEAGTTAPRFVLYVYSPDKGGLRRYPLASPLDLQKYGALLASAEPDVERLLAMIPRFKNGPLTALDKAIYLAGQGRQLILFDLSGRLHPLYSFPAPILDLSLTGQGRRLAVITGRRDKVQVYAWRLPEPALLRPVFPEEGDLSIGGLRLGMTAAEIRAVLGRPLEQKHRPDPVGERILETLYYPEAAVTLAEGRLVRLIYTAPGAATPRGLAVGSTLAGVYARYGRPVYRREDYLSYEGKLQGRRVKAAFTLQAGRVTAILLARDPG